MFLANQAQIFWSYHNEWVRVPWALTVTSWVLDCLRGRSDRRSKLSIAAPRPPPPRVFRVQFWYVMVQFAQFNIFEVRAGTRSFHNNSEAFSSSFYFTEPFRFWAQIYNNGLEPGWSGKTFRGIICLQALQIWPVKTPTCRHLSLMQHIKKHCGSNIEFWNYLLIMLLIINWTFR